MALISNVFGKMKMDMKLTPRETRINPRPLSMNKLDLLDQSILSSVGQIKDMSQFKNMDNNNVLGSFRPDNKQEVSKKELSPNYLPKEVMKGKELRAHEIKRVNEPMNKFEDWLILGGIIIAIGLFLRLKD